MNMNRKRLKILVEGRVQGVGFRPTVYRYALERNLGGWITNTASGVVIEIEGDKSQTDDFLRALKSSPPPQADISRISVSDVEPKNETEFVILPSEQGEVKTQVSPDLAVCRDCKMELFAPQNRRYRYPFINCTNCGPRFTIVKGIPYDRPKTTMMKFTMCPECNREYHDPMNRRFHAQPNACPVCGPHVFLMKTGETSHVYKKDEAIRETIRLLKQGDIVAIKGLGGFHLACDATNDNAVQKLRNKKYRYDKPFALMAKDPETINKYCEVSTQEEELLISAKSPIVLLKKRRNIPENPISDAVAPQNQYLGFMLPYTPLHLLLFERDLSVLVMTSGNASQEPLCFDNEEALERLRTIADFFLFHDRDIFTRCDDSVTRIFTPTQKEMLIRRSRGYAPSPLPSPIPVPKPVLAFGGHLANTFALARENEIVLSHHIGDLENLEALNAFEQGIDHYKKLFEIEASILACDMHPEYLSTKFAHELAASDTRYILMPIQHHHAHIASCMADNMVPNQKVIGVAFDGSGYGADGTIWGGEFLIADYKEFERVCHLKCLPLPGGEMAIKEPWRMAAVYLDDTFGEKFLEEDIEFVKRLDIARWRNLKNMMVQGFNSPLTSSMGRLFDAVSALAGIRSSINYEGQAAIELEMAISDDETADIYEYAIKKESGISIIHAEQIISGVVRDLFLNIPVGIISIKFHNTISLLILDVCQRVRSETKINTVALSGGVFQNIFLLVNTRRLLTENNFHLLIHSHVPPNDGGIALGQAAIAAALTKE